MSFMDDINNLDPNQPGLWPMPVKAVVFAVAFAAILFAGWKFDITTQREELAGLELKEPNSSAMPKLRQIALA